MPQYQAFSEDSEVMGRAMLGFVQSVNYDSIQPVLQKHKIAKIDPDKWYPLQQWLDVLSDISEAENSMFNFVSVGIKIFENLQFPPQFENMSYEEIIFKHDAMYQKSMRGSDVGGYHVERIGDCQLRITVRVPYPDDFVYGSLYGEAQRFLPEGTHFVLEYAENHNRREFGGEDTVFNVEWQA